MPKKPLKAEVVHKGSRILGAVCRLNVWKQAALLFSAGFFSRIILDALFFLRYGWHAVNHVETWFYYGVARGTHLPAGGLSDPTVWLLRLGGFLFPGETAFYFVVALSAVLSSLTAVAIYLLVKEQSNSLTGLYAGVIYSFLAQPLALSLVGFTHDHLQLLFFVLTLLFSVLAVKNCGFKRIIYAAAFILIAFAGLQINPVIKVSIGISLLYAAGSILAARLNPQDYGGVFYLMLLAVVVGGFFLSPYLTNDLSELPQGRSGSVDVAPITLSNFWLRFNIILILLPLGLYVGYARRDLIGLTLAAFGILLSSIMDRGARILDIGAAVLAAHVIADFREGYKKYFAYLTLLVLGFFLLSTNASSSYNIIFVFSATIMLAFAYKHHGGKRAGVLLALIAATGLATNLVYVYTADTKKISPEAEYELFKWLAGDKVEGKVMVGWDHGYYLEALTGLKAASTPNQIDYAAHDALWLPEKDAAPALRKDGIWYVMINDRNFNIIRRGSAYSFAISGGLVLEPSNIPPIAIISNTTVYKLRNGEADGRYFTKIRDVVDEATGVRLMLYSVNDGGES